MTKRQKLDLLFYSFVELFLNDEIIYFYLEMVKNRK